MQLTQKQINLINHQETVILATSNMNNEPRAIYVEINKVDGDELVITDNHMKITKNNILENTNVFILVADEEYKWGLKIRGVAQYYDSGNYFDFVRNSAMNKDYTPKGAIAVRVVEIDEF